jgi:hypothetical protein
MNNLIENYSHNHYDQPIPKNLTLTQYRNMFPFAIGINICNRHDITDAEFITNILPKYNPNFKRYRILKINISGCKQLTNAAFVPFNGIIHTLNMTACKQITDEAFANLSGIHTLIMS